MNLLAFFLLWKLCSAFNPSTNIIENLQPGLYKLDITKERTLKVETMELNITTDRHYCEFSDETMDVEIDNDEMFSKADYPCTEDKISATITALYLLQYNMGSDFKGTRFRKLSYFHLMACGKVMITDFDNKTVLEHHKCEDETTNHILPALFDPSFLDVTTDSCIPFDLTVPKECPRNCTAEGQSWNIQQSFKTRTYSVGFGSQITIGQLKRLICRIGPVAVKINVGTNIPLAEESSFEKAIYNGRKTPYEKSVDIWIAIYGSKKIANELTGEEEEYLIAKNIHGDDLPDSDPDNENEQSYFFISVADDQVWGRRKSEELRNINKGSNSQGDPDYRFDVYFMYLPSIWDDEIRGIYQQEIDEEGYVHYTSLTQEEMDKNFFPLKISNKAYAKESSTHSSLTSSFSSPSSIDSAFESTTSLNRLHQRNIFSSRPKPLLWNRQGASAFPVNYSVISEYELFFHPHFRLFTTLDSSCDKVSTSQLRSAADAISFSLFAHFRANQSISLHYSLSCLPELFNKRGESREPSSSCKGIGLTALSSVVKHGFVGIDCLDSSLRIVEKCPIRCTSDTAARISNLGTHDKNSCLSEKDASNNSGICSSISDAFEANAVNSSLVVQNGDQLAFVKVVDVSAEELKGYIMKHGPCVITFTVEQNEIDSFVAGWNDEMSVLGENDKTAENANAFTPNSKDANEKITRSVTVLGWGVSPPNSKHSSEIEYWLVKDQDKLKHSSDSAVDYYADSSTANISEHFEATSNSVPRAIRDTYRVAISSKLSTKDHLTALFFPATVETRGDVGGSFHVNIPYKISIVLGLILLLFSSSLL